MAEGRRSLTLATTAWMLSGFPHVMDGCLLLAMTPLPSPEALSQ